MGQHSDIASLPRELDGRFAVSTRSLRRQLVLMELENLRRTLSDEEAEAAIERASRRAAVSRAVIEGRG